MAFFNAELPSNKKMFLFLLMLILKNAYSSSNSNDPGDPGSAEEHDSSDTGESRNQMSPYVYLAMFVGALILVTCCCACCGNNDCNSRSLKESDSTDLFSDTEKGGYDSERSLNFS